MPLPTKKKKTPASKIKDFSNSMIMPRTAPGVAGPQQPLQQKSLPNFSMPSPTVSNIPTTYGQPQSPQPQQYPSMPIGNIPPPTNVMQGQQTGTQPPLTRINEQRTNESLNNYYGNKPFEFDYNTDPGYQAASAAAMTGVKNRMGAAGRLYDSFTDTQMTQAAMEVGLPYRQQAYNEYNMNTNQMKDRINTFSGAEDRLRNQEIAEYGVPLSPVARQYKKAYESMPPEMLNAVRAYQEDYAAEIMRREKIDPQDPLLPYLYAARSMKILSNPELMGKYSQDLGISSPGIAEMAIKYDNTVMKNEYDKLVAKYAPDKAKAEMDKLYADLQKAIASGDKAKFEASMKELELANLPKQLIAEINEMAARANQSNTQALENLSQVDLNKEKENTEKSKQLKAILEANKIEKESFDYQGFDRIDSFIRSQYIEKVSVAQEGDDGYGGLNEKGVTAGKYQGPGKQTVSSERIRAGSHKALAAYLLRLKANPDMDQDVVAALMAKYPIDTIVGGTKEVLK